MKLLIDTNIFIPLEPTDLQDSPEYTAVAAKLSRLASKTGTELWLHPAQRIDIAQDMLEQRRALREQLFQKYQTLHWQVPNPPSTNTNDWVDQFLVEALVRHAVTALVTEDRRLAQKAIKAVGPDRVLSLGDAISFLGSLGESPVDPPPAVERVIAYQLDLQDSFWDSFRFQYVGFDAWFRKCQAEHRLGWVIRDSDGQGLVGAALVNPELQDIRGAKTLKICSFKVDPQHSGRRYGELLLKSIFLYAYENKYDSLFITAYPEHRQLIALLEDFGFEREEHLRGSGELCFSKKLVRDFLQQSSPDALGFFIHNGPFVADLFSAPAYLVPIRPQFHEMLFPELQEQHRLLPGREAYGNSMKKAYLSSSAITELPRGSVLLFYRSEDDQKISAWGVVEDTLRSNNAEEICSFVLPRTVFPPEEISKMCNTGPVLAIMFRQGLRKLSHGGSLRDLTNATVISAAPQSIMQLRPETKQWMVQFFQRQP